MTPPPPLHTDRIEVWPVSVPATVPAALHSTLTAAERTRAARFVFDKDRSVYVTARGTLRQVLGSYLDLAPADVEIVTGPHGKPELAPHLGSQIRFNLSHSGSEALIALTLDHDVGIDIEHGHDHFDLLELAETVFSPRERARLAAADPARHRTLFYQHWVAKEAYIKALGGGLSIPLEAFSVAFDEARPGDRFTIVTNQGTSPVHGAWIEAPDGYAAAVARTDPAWSVRIHKSGDPTPPPHF